MADWQRTLNLTDVWFREITAQELAKIMECRLRALAPFDSADIEQEKSDLIDALDDFSQDDGSYDDLDCLLEELYNWGDISIDGAFGGKKVCWIKTHF